MEIKGKPGDTVWIRATLRKIVVTEYGVNYIVELKSLNSMVSFKLEDIRIEEQETAEDMMHKADQALAESPLYEDEKRRKKDGR